MPLNFDRMHISDEMNAHLFSSGKLSNFSPSPYVLEGKLFRTAEQGFMYDKARHFGDEQTARLIMGATLPSEAKKLGRQVRGFNEAEWSKVRTMYMMKHLRQKFTQNDHARQELLATGKQTIAEASPWDAVWGIGLSAKNAHHHEWGQNLLGECLMQVREELRAN